MWAVLAGDGDEGGRGGTGSASFLAWGGSEVEDGGGGRGGVVGCVSFPA